MQSLRSSLARSAAPQRALHACQRSSSHRLPATARALSTLPTPNAPPTPWFVDPSDEPFSRRQTPPHLPTRAAERPPLPAEAPTPIRMLHAALANSPHLEPAALLVTEPLPTAPGPPLPEAMPKGRRRRGRTYVGEGVTEPTGIWSWVVIAQVKEGTEKRGAIESVVRLVRKTLLACNPPLPLPLNSRKTIHDGWAMVDAGDFAVHVVSAKARETFFSNRERW